MSGSAWNLVDWIYDMNLVMIRNQNRVHSRELCKTKKTHCADFESLGC